MYTVKTVHCILYTVHCILYTVHWILYTLHIKRYSVHSTLYTIHTHWTVHSTLKTVHIRELYSSSQMDTRHKRNCLYFSPILSRSACHLAEILSSARLAGSQAGVGSQSSDKYPRFLGKNKKIDEEKEEKIIWTVFFY